MTRGPMGPPGDGGGSGGGGGGTVITGGGGGSSSCGGPEEQGVTDQGLTPGAITGGTMVALRSADFAVADPDRARVWLVSADFQTIRSVPLQTSDEPGRVIEGADGLVYVSLRRTSELAEIDFAAGTVRRLPTCEFPRGLAWRAADARLIVGCMGGALEAIDPLTGVRAPLTTTRGASVFVEAGCQGCHAGAQGTNNRTVDVGTGLALQVPRLVEFAWRGPWFHDGRMVELQDRFAPFAGEASHGQVSQLTAAQRDDLLVYLRSR